MSDLKKVQMAEPSDSGQRSPARTEVVRVPHRHGAPLFMVGSEVIFHCNGGIRVAKILHVESKDNRCPLYRVTPFKRLNVNGQEVIDDIIWEDWILLPREIMSLLVVRVLRDVRFST
jgi:hypothetical protein